VLTAPLCRSAHADCDFHAPHAGGPAEPVPGPVAPVQAATWKIDPTHSELQFRIRHLVSKVTGTFTDWDGTITGDPGDWQNGSVSVAIRATSISTNNERRDNDLRSPRFFDVATYPEVTFKSTSAAVSEESLTLTGDLTIRGVTKPVVLSGTYNGIGPGQDGRDRVGFEVTTKINRLENGVAWNRVLEGGGTLLGDEVSIQISIEAIKQP
jgi:polyisoprenoid-binding protein YceI